MSGRISKKCFCDFCKKEFTTINAKNGHLAYCNQNPNKKSAWNKGLTKETNIIVNQYIENMKNTKRQNQYIPWNKGLTVLNSDTVVKYTENMKKTKNTDNYKQRVKNNILKKYNGKHFTQTDEYKQKRKELFLKKYGVDNPLQNYDTFCKFMSKKYKRKEFKFSSGRVVNVMGFEHFALDIIINKLNISEIDIYLGCEIPPIYYYKEDKSKHRYFPDIYIKPLNKIIEVKSTYTINQDKKINLLKRKYSKLNGFDIEFWIISSNGKIIKKIKNLQGYYNKEEKI